NGSGRQICQQQSSRAGHLNKTARTMLSRPDRSGFGRPGEDGWLKTFHDPNADRSLLDSLRPLRVETLNPAEDAEAQTVTAAPRWHRRPGQLAHQSHLCLAAVPDNVSNSEYYDLERAADQTAWLPTLAKDDSRRRRGQNRALFTTRRCVDCRSKTTRAFVPPDRPTYLAEDSGRRQNGLSGLQQQSPWDRPPTQCQQWPQVLPQALLRCCKLQGEPVRVRSAGLAGISFRVLRRCEVPLVWCSQARRISSPQSQQVPSWLHSPGRSPFRTTAPRRRPRPRPTAGGNGKGKQQQQTQG
uniref:Kinesin motor domain-containing protein n=1 Tax=Macrostomum lignano TaxID=282301 RepID=A0A1I8FKG2_9PLAT